MMPLRYLSLHVEEPDHGEFYWVLLESELDRSVWREHSTSLHGFLTWGEAWTRGGIEYMRQVGDPRYGPRASHEDEDADPVG